MLKTASNDCEIKFIDYQAHGVREYWIIDPIKEVVEQYRLTEEETYELILKAGVGPIECLPVKGFKIEIRSIFDEAINLEELKRILIE